MIRDARMQALVAADSEPITPFIDRVRELYQEHGVSTVLVMGGSGDYFQVADHVEVTGAGLENGLLHITLKREIPEAMKPRTIQIGNGKAKGHEKNGKSDD